MPKQKDRKPTGPDRPSVSIVVANWEGENLIRKCLSALQISARRSSYSFEIIVVDDASKDQSCVIIEEEFPSCILVRNEHNVGFAKTVNRGVELARGQVVILANNDLVVKENFVKNISRWFFEEEFRRKAGTPLFAVSAKTVSWYTGEPNQVCMGAVWQGGRITPAWLRPRKAAPCLFVQAGAAAYHRETYLKLGGLSELFKPGYWEDYELSWMAASLGYTQLYDPESFALHHGGGSMTRRYGSRGVRVMKARNHLLFELIHLRGLRFIGEWILRIAQGLSRDIRKPRQERIFTTAFIQSLSLLKVAFKKRMILPRGRDTRAMLKPFRNFNPSE